MPNLGLIVEPVVEVEVVVVVPVDRVVVLLVVPAAGGDLKPVVALDVSSAGAGSVVGSVSDIFSRGAQVSQYRCKLERGSSFTVVTAVEVLSFTVVTKFASSSATDLSVVPNRGNSFAEPSRCFGVLSLVLDRSNSRFLR